MTQRKYRAERVMPSLRFNGIIWHIHYGDDVVGSLTVERIGDARDRIGYVEEVSVDPDHWRRGIGSWLYALAAMTACGQRLRLLSPFSYSAAGYSLMQTLVARWQLPRISIAAAHGEPTWEFPCDRDWHRIVSELRDDANRKLHLWEK